MFYNCIHDYNGIFKGKINNLKMVESIINNFEISQYNILHFKRAVPLLDKEYSNIKCNFLIIEDLYVHFELFDILIKNLEKNIFIVFFDCNFKEEDGYSSLTYKHIIEELDVFKIEGITPARKLLQLLQKNQNIIIQDWHYTLKNNVIKKIKVKNYMKYIRNF